MKLRFQCSSSKRIASETCLSSKFSLAGLEKPHFLKQLTTRLTVLPLGLFPASTLRLGNDIIRALGVVRAKTESR